MSDSPVVSLAEFSCWDGDELRAIRKKIWFTIRSVGKIEGLRVSQEFQADFGLMYDGDNQYTIELLGRVCPEVRWDRMFYWRRCDISGIDVVCARSENLVARLRVRDGGGSSGKRSRLARGEVQLGAADAVVYDFVAALEAKRARDSGG